MPLMPLFSPVYTSTRPYSQTKSSAQRPLMYPNEIMRMDNQECLVLLRGKSLCGDIKSSRTNTPALGGCGM